MTTRRVQKLVAALGLGLALLMGVLWFIYDQIQSRPLMDSERPAQVLDIPSGTGVAGILQRMEAADLTFNPLALRVYLRLKGMDLRLQAGEYAVSPSDTAAGLMQRIARGAVIEYSFTIVEGWRYSDLIDALVAHPKIVSDLLEGQDQAVVMKALDREGLHPEGQFLPETYRFTRGTSALRLLERANRALEAELAAAWEARAVDSPLTAPYEALILASIIEKETGLAEERRKIAGVFSRRINLGMRLQTDPTVIYGLGEAFTGRLSRQDLRTDTPWNTYTRHGLPPTPIALAGAASIHAAVDPAEGDALFFVSRGDGSHVFSVTLEAHNAAVRRYILGKDD